jgi:hypothetical protein
VNSKLPCDGRLKSRVEDNVIPVITHSSSVLQGHFPVHFRAISPREEFMEKIDNGGHDMILKGTIDIPVAVSQQIGDWNRLPVIRALHSYYLSWMLRVETYVEIIFQVIRMRRNTRKRSLLQNGSLGI